MINITGDSSEEDEVVNELSNEQFAESNAGVALKTELIDADEELEDEPLPLLSSVQSEELSAAGHDLVSALISVECSDALTAVSTDPWDISSWIIFIEEAEQNRGGSITAEDAYCKILNQFPRSAKFAVKLAEFYINRGDKWTAVADTFEQYVAPCRCVELWKAYLDYMKKVTIDSVGIQQHEQYALERKRYEALFERAIDAVGMSLNAIVLWKDYLAFIQTWPELSATDTSRKLNSLRNIYKRAIAMPIEHAEDIWNEYEAFEKKFAGKAVGSAADAESVAGLQEAHKRFLHARSIYRERKRLTASIVFDRLATPPLHSWAELQQLEMWNSWLKCDFYFDFIFYFGSFISYLICLVIDLSFLILITCRPKRSNP
jgi:hypothetical protein